MDGDHSRRRGIPKKMAARADLISPALEDGRHTAQPHGNHVVDGDDQLPFVVPHGPWRPPNLNHRGLPFGTASSLMARQEEAPLHLEEGLRLVVTFEQPRRVPASVRAEF